MCWKTVTGRILKIRRVLEGKTWMKLCALPVQQLKLSSRVFESNTMHSLAKYSPAVWPKWSDLSHNTATDSDLQGCKAGFCHEDLHALYFKSVWGIWLSSALWRKRNAGTATCRGLHWVSESWAGICMSNNLAQLDDWWHLNDSHITHAFWSKVETWRLAWVT